MWPCPRARGVGVIPGLVLLALPDAGRGLQKDAGPALDGIRVQSHLDPDTFYLSGVHGFSQPSSIYAWQNHSSLVTLETQQLRVVLVQTTCSRLRSSGCEVVLAIVVEDVRKRAHRRHAIRINVSGLYSADRFGFEKEMERCGMLS